MRTVTFPERTPFEMAAALAGPLGAHIDTTSLTIKANNSLAALLERLALKKPTVLPIREADSDTWLIMGEVRPDLEATLTTIGHFVIPTYAEYATGVPEHQTFDPLANEVNRLGAQVYPAGYYRLRSPVDHFDRMLERLGQWAILEQRRPPIEIEQHPTYRELYDAFNAVLSAGTWDRATEILNEIRQRGLSTADNLAFLSVQLLAQQRRWGELWRREDFQDIARLRMPRTVQAALLAAFHQSELLPLEQQNLWVDALETFRKLRGRLGGLLEGTADTSYGPVLRVYAYREASIGDRHALSQLMARASDDETRRTIEELTNLLPPLEVYQPQPVPSRPAIAPQQAATLALMEGDYATARAISKSIEDPTEQVILMLKIAYSSDDYSDLEDAFLHFWSLTQSEQERVLQQQRLAKIISSLELSLPASATTDAQPEQPPLTDWLSWLAAAVVDADDSRLPASLSMVAKADERYWNNERVAELAERLTELVAGDAGLSRPHLRTAVRNLRDYFLQDPEFPREQSAYDEVYEALYLATLEQKEVNESVSLALLRLAEARLRRAPTTADTVAEHLCRWLTTPVPAMEAVALELLDLLAAYGVQGSTLAQWYRGWVEKLLETPRQLSRLNLESWLLFGEWIQPGTDLLDALRQRLDALGTRKSDPVATLPSGYKIGIFTLSPARATRVRDALQRRNPNIEVVICDDKVLTEQAKSLAQNADMVVVVTTCVKHALTYGIGPYLHDPVYPQSSGSTSILHAIEDRLESHASIA